VKAAPRRKELLVATFYQRHSLMKTTDKNEMDLLLRALGRDASSRLGNASLMQSDPEVGAHLDADELNCYAEGIVSEAERARYNKHLADCDSCRRLIVGLVPAAGVTRHRELVEHPTEWSWRRKLAALLAPSVVRYAVPALALTAIIAIAIVTLRQRQTEFIAKNETPTAPAVSSDGESQKATTSNIPQSAGSPELQQQALADSKEKNLSRSEKSDVIPPPVVASKTEGDVDREAKGFLKPRQPAGVAESQPTFAAEPTDAAAPPPPRPTMSEASKAAEARQDEAETAMQKRSREESRSQSRDENESARRGPAKGGPSRNNSQNVGGLSGVMSGSANKDARAAGSPEETRKVSGRLFHRQGNAWIDAGYASGRTTVNVRRGSEQFRALIADEAGLRSIAEQLGGEVIVVWKGTAYRIR
jgi:hypothetical protein